MEINNSLQIPTQITNSNSLTVSDVCLTPFSLYVIPNYITLKLHLEICTCKVNSAMFLYYTVNATAQQRHVVSI